MKSAVVLGIILVGIVFVLLSVAWGLLFPPTSSWTPEKATRMSDVRSRINELSFKVESPRVRSIHSGPDPATLKAELVQLNSEFDQLASDFESAAVTPKTTSSVLKWSGISILAIGVIGWYAVNQSG